jgi:ribonuclease-3
MPADLQELEARIGYCFRDRTLLVRAVTHSSYASEIKPTRLQPDNEQLEFFGDSILGFLISEQLVLRHSDLPEGHLSHARSHLVSEPRLFDAAKTLGIGEFLHLGRGEEMGGGRSKKSLLSNALEAIVAAIYLDGGMDAARSFVVEHVYHEPLRTGVRGSNYKAELWERAMAEHMPLPEYSVVEELGPSHQREFVVEARLGRMFTGRGKGTTKKSAQQLAAREILDQMIRTEA